MTDPDRFEPIDQRKTWQLTSGGILLRTGLGRTLAARTNDLVIQQGQAWRLPITYMDDSEQILDLSAATAICKVRTSPSAESAVISIDESGIGDGIALGNGTPPPNLILALTADTTAELEFTRGWIECDLTIDDVAERIFEGCVALWRRVTQ